MVTGLRAGCAHLCDSCYLVVAQLIVVAQDEYQLLPCRQGPYCLLESDALQVAVVRIFVSGHCIDSCARSVDGDLSLPAAFQYPQSLVRGDSVDPGFERTVSPEPVGGPEYPDESLLSGVLRIIVRDRLCVCPAICPYLLGGKHKYPSSVSHGGVCRKTYCFIDLRGRRK